MSIYRVAKHRENGKALTNAWDIFKMDKDLNPLDIYTIREHANEEQKTKRICSCPAYIPNCRHKTILSFALKNGLVDKAGKIGYRGSSKKAYLIEDIDSEE